MRLDHALFAVALVALGFSATACGGDDDDGTVAEVTIPPTTSAGADDPGPEDTSPPSGPATETSPSPSPTASGPVPGADRPDVQAAVADAAARAGAEPAAVVVVSVEEVTWPDGSLGCPQPGVGYTQALVNGQRVVLGIGSERFEYHSGPDRALFFCAEPGPAASGGGAGDT